MADPKGADSGNGGCIHECRDDGLLSTKPDRHHGHCGIAGVPGTGRPEQLVLGVDIETATVAVGSRAPVRPQRDRLFPSFAPVAPAERPVQVVELSFEILTGERPGAVPPLNSAVETE
jgi:hypothetical protein